MFRLGLYTRQLISTPSPRPGGESPARGRPPAPVLYRHIPDPGRHRTHFYAHYANRVRGERPDEEAGLKHLSHPVIGDATYGKGPLNRAFAGLFRTPRLLLACVELPGVS